MRARLPFKTGELEARITFKNYLVEYFYEGRYLTRSGYRRLGYITTNEGDYFREQLDLSVGEKIYGMGERFTPFVKNGQTVESWNEDGGTSSEQAYKNIPFYLSSNKYGLFVDHAERVSFEVASEAVSRVQFSLPGQKLRYHVVGGASRKEVLARYTTLTGKPALPPAWSFGLWLTTSFTTDYNEETVTHFVDGMAERNIPLHVFHFDCFWMKEYEWCNFTWDSEQFADPDGMLKRLREDKGLKVSLWINPYIGQKSPLFAQAGEAGYLLKRPNGDIWQWDLWQPGMALVDFTNPDACKWYQEQLRVLIHQGVDSFKTDFGERIPTDVAYFDGSDPVGMHNYYTQLYNKCVFDLLVEELGEGKAVLFARSATAGGQQFPIHWGGDCDSTYESMAESIRGGLSLTLSGFGYWSHDIGGFEATATPDVYKRWAAFGLLSTHSRLHGSSSYRVPWLFDEEAVAVMRYFTNLKCQLMPYLFSSAVDTAKTGVPSMRALLLEFEDDPTCLNIDTQYMLGERILVAPIFRPDSIGEFYLPAGHWTHLLSGEKAEGGKWYQEGYDYFSLPLFVRENTLLPMGTNQVEAAYDYKTESTLRLYELQDGATAKANICHTDGTEALSAVASRVGKQVTIELIGNTEKEILLVNVDEIAYLVGAEQTTTKEGVLLTKTKAAVTYQLL